LLLYLDNSVLNRPFEGGNTQGATLEEARENLKEAVDMVLQANRELTEESSCDPDIYGNA